MPGDLLSKFTSFFFAFYDSQKKHVLNQMLICSAFGRSHWSIWKFSAVSFFNLLIVSRSGSEFPTPIGTFLVLRSG